jgi:hypothetical protein
VKEQKFGETRFFDKRFNNFDGERGIRRIVGRKNEEQLCRSIHDSVMWYVDPLLGNDREISSYTTTMLSNGSANKHVSTAEREYSNNGKRCFSARSVPRCYKQDKLEVAVR